MKKILISCFLLVTILGMIGGVVYAQLSKEENPNRIYFSINPKDRKITLPIQLNDSITANMTFDSAISGSFFSLDSTFCAVHPSVIANQLPDTVFQSGSLWAELQTPRSIYKTIPAFKIGDTSCYYDGMKVSNWKWYMNTTSDGLFNIPSNDTTHVWEFNFEHSYMEIHSAQDFNMPVNCFIAPIVKKEAYPYGFSIKLPIKIKCANGDTLMLDRTFLIDTGMPWDVALMHRSEELAFFNTQKDAVWTKEPVSYNRYYTVNATLFDCFKMDSLRIYTLDYANRVPWNYLIGLNFLKRFNVFFDMKSQCVGLQPIKNFQRVVNPLHKRFHFGVRVTPQGKVIVSKVADYKANYYKTAGLREGDEIVSLNETPYKEVPIEVFMQLDKQDTLRYGIIRQGKPLEIVVVVDKNEIQGD